MEHEGDRCKKWKIFYMASVYYAFINDVYT